MIKRSAARKNAVYLPPDSTEIQKYSRSVCKEFATVEPIFDTPEVQHELAGFIKVVAAICAKQLNKSSEILDIEE